MGKLLAAVVGLSALFGTGHLFAQSVSAVQVQPDEAPALCQDIEPANDGFGWNGRCSCTTGQPLGMNQQTRVASFYRLSCVSIGISDLAETSKFRVTITGNNWSP